ncbi:MAG: OmpA family protein, partial [Cyclobacteriaceae bacterium]
MKRILLVNFISILLIYNALAQTPCDKHPLFNMLPQHSISDCNEQEFDNMTFKYYDKNGDYIELKKSGYALKTSYVFDGDFEKRPSNPMIFQNYVNAVKAKGGTLINESKSKVLLQLKTAGEDWWIEVYSDQSGTYYLNTIREASMNQFIVLSANEIAKEINSTGKATFYGIFFDSDKSIVKPESKETLEQMAKYLTANPKVKVFIVGHTDNTGSFDHNLELSKKRAEAVIQELVSTYSISTDRLKAHGVSALSPIASNQ